MYEYTIVRVYTQSPEPAVGRVERFLFVFVSATVCEGTENVILNPFRVLVSISALKTSIFS